jgi:predicted nuclease of predicted toxin-antitoxin system
MQPIGNLQCREDSRVIMTKDSDFVKLQDQYGSPPEVIWLACGNTSNRALRALLTTALPQANALLEAGEGLVEISGPQDQRR